MNGDRNHIEPRFLFHAEALGLAAHIRQPKEYFVDSVASSTLAITGGRAQARVGPGEVGIISYQSAATHVCGDFLSSEEIGQLAAGNGGENILPTRTAAQVTVTGFKLDVPLEESGFHLFGRPKRTVLVEHAEAMLASISDRQGPNAYKTLDAVLRGVSIDGRELHVDIDTQLFTENCTKRKLDGALNDEVFRERCSHQILYDGPELIIGTVVKDLRWEKEPAPGSEIRGNQLIVPGIGSLYFGEIVIEEGFRRLTLMRFELGSSDGGHGPAEDSEQARIVRRDATSSGGGQTSPPGGGQTSPGGGSTSSSTTGSGILVQADSNGGTTSPPQGGGKVGS